MGDTSSDSSGMKNWEGKDKEMTMDLMRKAAALVRASNVLPRVGDNYELCSSFGVFSEYMTVSRKRILAIMKDLYVAAGVKIRMPNNVSDMNEFMERIVDANDMIAERAGIVLDEIERTHRREKVVVPKAISQAESIARVVDVTGSCQSTLGMKFTGAVKGDLQQNIANLARLRAIARHQETIKKVVQIRKPQKEFGFATFIDNSRNIFIPNLKVKHNAKPNKEGGITITDETEVQSRPWSSDETDVVHPYLVELNAFEVPKDKLQNTNVQKYDSIEATPYTYVSTCEQLSELRDYLNTLDEFAVDLEHHDYRSFLGFTCLIQISSRKRDYLIDPFPIWSHMNILNEPFTNPKILKVLHGSDRDIEWLQRDFGVFVVNLFDTGRAMRHLGMPKYSLAYLVENKCGVVLNKQFQTTDWRVRPLPEDMQLYARCDTHYLLFCYDELRNQLIQQGNQDTNNLLQAVYMESTSICKKLFEKPQFDATGFSHLIATRRSLNNRQVYAMKELWRWRDETARAEDESLGYVLPSHMMMHIAESLPRDMQSILACCSPIPVPVKEHLLALHRLILDARDRPLEKVTSLSLDGDLNNLASMKKGGNKTNSIDAVTGLLLTNLNMNFEHDDEDIVVRIEDIALDTFEIKDNNRTYLSVFTLNEIGEEGDDASKDAHKSVTSIRNEFLSMASPYECYQLAIKDREKRLIIQRAEEAKTKVTDAASGEKRFSHHDSTICRKPVWDEDKNMADDIQLSSKQVQNTDILDDQTLTKKALKKKIQKNKRAADIDLSDGGRNAKNLKLENKEEEQSSTMTVDYSQYDTNMFEHKPRVTHGYDPNRIHARGGVRRGRGNRGKMHRSGAGSVSFKM